MIQLFYKISIFSLSMLCSCFVLGQSGTDSIQAQPVDSYYLEDQFYVGVGYNVLLNSPDALDQRNLSYNLQLGFIKDIPLNKRRNFGLGVGLGYAANSYYSNMGVTEDGDVRAYQILDDENFNRSKLETHAIEFPLEVRWRTSTATEYRFWRIYAGAKLGYVFSGRSKLVTDEGNVSFSNDDIDALQYGLMLNFGYNTWNIHAYYSLNPLLKERASIAGESIDLRVLRVGLTFYIL
ncbi:outer membrane beta-barrel protein [Muricauda sp. HICW]|uniref:Outer membrane beta-barrel protein n=1 Tax=Flagellimonas chongwuensis TaxID=2697365 RepID=A0A850NL09_9FLAO|nr:porin family protein [Allomuricauda chongwuensis]NVN17937.1 outer membrane beta-barrel protein [Allomuricauda chongwuensis]